PGTRPEYHCQYLRRRHRETTAVGRPEIIEGELDSDAAAASHRNLGPSDDAVRVAGSMARAKRFDTDSPAHPLGSHPLTDKILQAAFVAEVHLMRALTHQVRSLG